MAYDRTTGFVSGSRNLPTGSHFMRQGFVLLALALVWLLTVPFALQASEWPHKESARTSQDSSVKIQRQLLRYFRSWEGVPYRFGGLSRRGIDCSGFVYLTFKHALGIKLPRSTELMTKMGNVIRRKGLRQGDLVFFKTARRTRHVGIYVGKDQFIHASKTHGVMLSSLDNAYWLRTYWKAVRVIR